MILRVFTVSSLIAATSFLAACQTIPDTFVSEEEEACMDAGLTPGTAIYDDCVATVAEFARDFEKELERDFRGIDVRIDCEVYFEDDEIIAFCEVAP